MKNIFRFLLQICFALLAAGWSTSLSQTNVLAAYNGDFELGLAQWRFFEVPTALGSTASVVTTDVAQGIKAIKLTFVSPDSSLVDRALDNWNTNVPVVGGQNYKVSVQAKTPSTGTLKLSIAFGFFDASHTIVGQISNGFLLSSSYQKFSITGIAPATSAYCWIAFRLIDGSGKNVAGTLFLDDAQLLRTPLVFAQEFHTGWRTPRYISGQAVTGMALSSPWTRWAENQWTIFDPEEIISGTWRRNTISQGYPLIGPFDTRNADVLRWHIRLAKNAGLSGVLVDEFFNEQTGYFDPEYLSIFAQLLDISQQENFKIGIMDEAAFGSDKVRDLAIMTDRVTKALLQFKDHPAYLRINNEPIYQFNFYGNLGAKWSYADLKTFFTNVESVVGKVYWMIQDVADVNVLPIAQLSSIEDASLWPIPSDSVDWTGVSNYMQQFVSTLHSHHIAAAINIFPGFNDKKLQYPRGNYRVHRDHGNTLSRQLDLASQTGADFVVISSLNDWQENSAITPGWDFEDYAGDPYQYLKIIASYTGTVFIPPPLPSKDSLDPLIWGKLFGIDKAGPVPSQVSFDSDSTFSTIVVDDMSNVAVAEYFVDGFHSIRLKATNAENSLHLANVSDGVTSVVNRGGRTARSTDGVTGRYFYIDDTGVTLGDYDAYVSVEYFDNGTSSFGIQFSSTSAPYNSTTVEVKENTQMWKTHVFHLDHAAFDGKENGASDFRLFESSDSLIVARIGVILTGKGSLMYPQDGVFNSLSEKVYHSVSAINDGDLHGIYVHGKDTVGNWGMSWSPLLTTLPWTVTAPTVPSLTSPTDSSKGISINPSLTWSSVMGVTSYRVQLSTSPSFSSFVLDDSTIVTTSRQVGPLLNNTTYYWRARAKNYKGTSGWSPVRSFTTIVAAPQTPTLAVPANSAVGLPLNAIFRWRVITTATSYWLQVAKDSLFTSPVTNDSTISDTLRQMNGLTVNTKYYWRVRAMNTGGVSPYSSIWSFTTGTSTSVVQLNVVPTVFNLEQNYPNPFNPSTSIRYGLPNRSSVKLVITNTLGQKVAVLENGEQEAGYHEVEWRANVASGIYFYRIDAVNTSDPNNRFVQVKKMLMLK